MSVVLEGHVDARDRERDPYLELPFDVEEGATRIDVRYRHDAGSVLDLGLAEPELGAFPSRHGFRGWSGGARDHVVVTRDWATPGYLPGALPVGRWRVLLGLASVAPAGCGYRVEIDVGTEAPGPAPERAARGAAPRPAGGQPRPGGPSWSRGDLQCHTHHSDARGSLDDLRVAALRRGLDFVAVTDHNTVSHHAPLAAMDPDELLWVPGMEVTTYRGHANVWGVRGWVDFRARTDDDVATLVRHVHERGGLVSVNHPKAAPGCIGCDWEYDVPEGVDCLEAWQGPWPLRNWESLDRYDALLRSGRRVTLVGGSDRHQPPQPDVDPPSLQVGSPTTWLRLATRSVAGVLDSLRHGLATVSEGPTGPFVEIEVDGAPMGSRLRAARRHAAIARVSGAEGETLRWIGAAGPIREVPIDGDSFEDAVVLEPPGPFVRAEVTADRTLGAHRDDLLAAAAAGALGRGLDVATVLGVPYRRALSNPVYFAPDRA